MEEKGSDTCTRHCHYEWDAGFRDFAIRNLGNVVQKSQYLERKVSKLSQISITSFPFDLTEDADIFLDPVIRLFLPCPILMPLLPLVPVKMRESETLKETTLECMLGFRISR